MNEQGSLRLDAIGDVARPFEVVEVVEILAPIAALVDAGHTPSIILLSAVVSALYAGRRPGRGAVVLRSVSTLIEALVVVLALDARQDASRRRLHDAVRKLELPALDALEDLLARFPAIRPIIEAERMYRAGLLDADWVLVLDGRTEPDGRISARVVASLRLAPVIAEA